VEYGETGGLDVLRGQVRVRWPNNIIFPSFCHRPNPDRCADHGIVNTLVVVLCCVFPPVVSCVSIYEQNTSVFQNGLLQCNAYICSYDKHTDLLNTKSRIIAYFTIKESPRVRWRGSDRALSTKTNTTQVREALPARQLDQESNILSEWEKVTNIFQDTAEHPLLQVWW
jgi:hypothetical protein